MPEKWRIGIDVGGTFTDAVLINNDTYELAATMKIPTTHVEGVAIGIIRILTQMMEEYHISPDDIIFVAHGTTQATNALLEADVARVGVIGIGEGMDARKAKSDTNVSGIMLAAGKELHVDHKFINIKDLTEESIDETLDVLTEDGSQVVVASAAYSVEDPTHELLVIERAQKKGIMATGGHEISQLFGLKIRTRTAVINGSLIPRMMETADMTEEAIRKAQIESVLMIMRCDGGVMSIDEVRKRPILTMLSGLAAGVAGALMYEKVSDGIFFEAGGTSTDIAVIKDGKVILSNAQVGGHKTYLRSLDIRTLGVAGGSMISVVNNKIVDVGPRSAHIANLHYECFVGAEEMSNPRIQYISPKEDDPPNYAIVTVDNGKKYALTLVGAANLLGYVPEGDYSRGNVESTKAAWRAFGESLGIPPEEAALQVMNVASDKVMKIVSELVLQYVLDKGFTAFVGGGGSASVIVPFLAQREGYNWRIAQNAPSISAIGVALAMVREEIEKTVISPQEQDIQKIRKEVIEKIVRSGATPETVEVTVEIDPQKNILRAYAIGSTELRNKEMTLKLASPEMMKETAASALGCKPLQICPKGQAARWYAFEFSEEKKSFLGLVTKKESVCCVMDREGVVRLKKRNGKIVVFPKSKETLFHKVLDERTDYSESNAVLPGCHIFFGEKMLDLSSMGTINHLQAMFHLETENLEPDEEIIAIVY